MLERLEGFEPSTQGVEAPCSIPLSYRRIVGTPGEIRTPDQSVRSRLFYSAELRVHGCSGRVCTFGEGAYETPAL